MPHYEHNHHPHAPALNLQSPTEMLRGVIEPTPSQDSMERLNIVTTMRSLMARQPSPDMVRFVKDQLQITTHPQVRAFMQLIISEDPRYRMVAEEGLKLLEHKLQEDHVHQQVVEAAAATETFPSTETITRTLSPADADARRFHGRDEGIDMLAAFKGFEASPAAEPAKERALAKVLPFTVAQTPSQKAPWHTPQEGVPSISIPTGTEPNSPRKVYSYISSTQAVDRHIATVAGLVMGIKGQPEVEHGFGFYIPVPEDAVTLDYTGQKRNIIRIAMSLPQTIVLYDDHRGPHLGGISNFFTIYEAMLDGYRFLLDLEIIPINGRFALSIQEAIHIDRHDTDGAPSFVSSVHFNKLAHACAALGFHAFTGEANVNA